MTGKFALQSPNDQFRVELELTDNGELKPHFFISEEGEWREVQSASKPLARWGKHPKLGWIRFF
jgi:hypothetical protein